MRHTTDPLIRSLMSQYELTFKLLRRTIDCFADDQWKLGISGFEVPAKVAVHTLQCLVYYFRDDPQKEWNEVPARFRKDWWEMTDDELPGRKEVLTFLDDVEWQVTGYLEKLTSEELGGVFPGHGTVLGNILYALRHTMHHQGGMNVLSVHHGIDADLWDRDG